MGNQTSKSRRHTTTKTNSNQTSKSKSNTKRNRSKSHSNPNKSSKAKPKFNNELSAKRTWTAQEIKKANKDIEQQLLKRLKRTKYNHCLQVLLLGAGGSGKSTVFKQLEMCHDGDKGMEDMEEAVPDLCINIIQDIYDLCKYRILLEENPSLVSMPIKVITGYTSVRVNSSANTNSGANDDRKESFIAAYDESRINIASTTIKLSLESERYLETGQENPFILSSNELRNAAQQISEWNPSTWLLGDNPLNPKLAVIIQKLWADPAMKNTLRNRKRSNIMDNTQFILDHVIEIAANNFEMTFGYYVLIRDLTTGVTQCDLTAKTIFGDYELNITDVGGQRSERSKWIKVFNNIDVVLYVIALSAYDQVLFEDPMCNCLTETLKLFYETCHHQLFSMIDWIVFFNKSDIFEDKVVTVPFTVYRPDFSAEEKNNSLYIREYMQKEIEKLFYAELNEEEKKIRGRIYFHYTCATNKEKVGGIIVNMQCDIIKSQLIKCGYLL